MPDTQNNAKVLTLMVRKVNKNAIRKNTEIIRLYSSDSDIGGCVSAYMPRMRIWVDASTYMTQEAIWVDAIRLYRQNRDMDGQLSVYMPNWTI
jgi:predicted NAD-dependent protein-ADP-ribosyltransferase YbiA (DUF1768 family)